MYSYIIGIVDSVYKDHIVLDHQDIGYHIYVAHPEDFKYDEKVKVHIYTQVRDDGTFLFGFFQKEEKELFMRLIDVTGIGPKTAIAMMSATTYMKLVQAIESGNTSFLKKLPGIGPKASQQIILDLKGKLVLFDQKEAVLLNQALEDAKEALRQFGFRNSDIERVMSKIGNEPRTSEEYLKIALTLIKKG